MYAFKLTLTILDYTGVRVDIAGLDTTHISYSLRFQLAGETVHIVGRRDRM